jgi:CRISPR type IV-associated protein Csf3
VKPLKITFRFATASKVPEYPINLDGLLAYACVQEYAFVENSTVSIDDAHEMLPLEKDEKLGVWKSSNIQFEHGERQNLIIQRTFDLNEVVNDNGVRFKALRRNKWDAESSSSSNKAYLFAEPMRLSPSATAYCIGDAEKIAYLLNKHITHVGKYARIDAGRVTSITVEESDQADKYWLNRTLAKLPEVFLFQYAKAFETVKPPYWKRENRQVCYVPTHGYMTP